MEESEPQANRIKRTFVFDRKIDPADYEKFIRKEDIVDTNQEQLLKEF